MPSGTYLPDESSLSRVQTDPEQQMFWGTDYGVVSGPRASGNQDAILLDNLMPDPGDAALAFARASAPGVAQLDGPDPTATKYADELFENMYYTLAPTAGQLDGDKGAVLTQGYDPYDTKEPKLRGNERPSTGEIAANTATSPGASLPSTEEQLMQLLFSTY